MSITNEKTWTNAQKTVISDRGKSLLVSASAGSGKTSTMIERMARLIEEGVSVTEILALTFTKAAAAEMREKLWDRLLEMGIRGQEMEKFPLASIGTIDSFCSDILRANFEKAGIDPAFSVLEGIGKEVLFAQAMEETLEECYQKNSGEFFDILDAFGKKRTDKGLRQAIKNLFECAINTADPEKWIWGIPNFYTANKAEEIARRLAARYTEAAEFFCLAIEDLSVLCHRAKMRAFEDALFEAKSQIQNIAVQNDLEKIYTLILAFKFPSLPSKGKQDDALLVKRVKSLAEKISLTMTKFQEEFAGRDFATLSKERVQAGQNARTLADITLSFMRIYEKKKQEQGVLDFSDLEHAVNKLLSEESIQKEIAAKYKYVFVDEYQDVNDLQESILQKLSGENNRFMVGDVKQSIYAFRHSDPEIILARMEALDCQNKKIDLDHNFRSRKEILEFVNLVFDKLMTKKFGSTDYKNGHRLISGRKAAPPETRVWVDFVTDCKQDRLTWGDGVPMPYEIGCPVQKKGISHAEAEAIIIAGKIKDLLSKGLTYRDIVILTRNQTEHAYCIFRALQGMGIPVTFPPEKMPEKNAEVERLLCFMSVINNPRNDIALGATLTSFLYGFSAADLIEIRRTEIEQEVDFFDKLCRNANLPQGQKSKKFLQELERYRTLSKSLSAHELLSLIVKEKSVERYIRQKEQGDMRAAALFNFLSAVRESKAQDIEEFCRHFEKYGIEKSFGSGEDDNTVQMLSIHNSKGLEYPAVILAGLGCKGKNDDDDAVVDKNFGVGLDFYDSNRQKNCTLNKAAAKAEASRRNREEALRVLYVGLTRAKEYLCLTGCMDKFPEAEGLDLHPYTLSQQKTYIDWLAAVFANIKTEGFEFRLISKNTLAGEEEKETTPIFSHKDEEAVQKLRERMDFCYPFASAVTQQYKTAASEIARLLYPVKKLPSTGVAAEQSQADTGTLYHNVLRHINLGAQDIASEIERLVREGVLSETEGKSLDRKMIEDVLHLPLMQRAAKNKNFREQPFMMLLPSEEIGGHKGDDVIVQGVVDLLFFEGGEAVVVDYKYTALSLDRLKNNYAPQLKLYARAVESILNMPVKAKYILSLRTGEVVEV